MISRRKFLTNSSIAATALVIGKNGGAAIQAEPKYAAEIDPNIFEKFVDPLPLPPVAVSAGMRPDPTDPKRMVPYYKLPMRANELKVHREMKPTTFWTFGGAVPGPTFETRSGEGLLVEWQNGLPEKHFLPIDHKIHGAESDKPAVRAVVHMHGAKARPESDGYPEDWFVPGKSAIYHYPNNQDAGMLWYHDHALGINRLNVHF